MTRREGKRKPVPKGWVVLTLGAVHKGLWNTELQKLPCPPIAQCHHKGEEMLREVARRLNAFDRVVLLIDSQHSEPSVLAEVRTTLREVAHDPN